MRRFLCLLILVPFANLLPPAPAPAYGQRGALIEDLFRTIAEAQLEREQRKRLEAERVAREQAAATAAAGSEGSRPPIARPTLPPAIQRSLPGQSINVRSQQAAEFAQNLVNFHAAVTPLVQEMRAGARGNVAVRTLLPEAYQVSADTRALLGQCNGLDSLDPIVAPYAELDARWRQLSFRLRSLEGLSDTCTRSIRSGDQLISRLSRQLKIQPQFDRHGLHDLMIIAGTYMQALIDDLQIANIPREEIRRMTHDCRVLRQRLLAEADVVDGATYEDVVTRFTDFVSRWNSFSEQVYAVNDVHLRRRLDRIAECVDQTYALLWMPAPYNAAILTASAQRLHQSCVEVLDQLSIRALASLDRQQRFRVLDSSHQLVDQTRAFVEAAAAGASRSQRRKQFAEIDANWAYLRGVFYELPVMNQATLASVDHECHFIRGALGLSAANRPLDHEDLIEAAAALEGASEYLVIDIRRYERYLTPPSYRQSIVDACQEFHLHARQLYTELSRRSALPKLQREAEHMLDAWQRLSEDLSHIDGHGLSERRAQSLRRDREQLVPLVAKIAAALIEQ